MQGRTGQPSVREIVQMAGLTKHDKSPCMSLIKITILNLILSVTNAYVVFNHKNYFIADFKV